jgi:bacteriocin biosynthesis cyclodehydratase domain-containing protein
MISGDQKVRLRPEFEVIPLAGDKVLLRAPHQGVRVGVEGVRGAKLAAVLRSMDGNRSVTTLLAEGGDAIEPLVRGLVARDILDVDGAPPPRSDIARYFSQFHEDPTACMQRLAESCVVVVGSGSLAECMARDLRLARVGKVTRALVAAPETEKPGASSDRPARHEAASLPDHLARIEECRALARESRGAHLVVACFEDGGRSRSESVVNEVALELRLTWVSARIFGSEASIGPLFVPGEGPCHACLLAREEANWVDPELTRSYLARITDDSSTLQAYGRLPAFTSLTSQWVVLDAIKYLSGFLVPTLIGQMLRVDFLGYRTTLHRVLRLPRCAQCSAARGRPGVNALLYAEPKE